MGRFPGRMQQGGEDEDSEVEREADDIFEARAPVDRPAERQRAEDRQGGKGRGGDEERPVEAPPPPGPSATATIAIQVSAVVKPSATLPKPPLSSASATMTTATAIAGACPAIRVAVPVWAFTIVLRPWVARLEGRPGWRSRS